MRRRTRRRATFAALAGDPAIASMQDGPSTGALKTQLALALGEAFAQAPVDRVGRKRFAPAVLAYALRLIYRYGLEESFYESIETSARALNVNEKTVRHAREELVSLGFLVDLGTKHGPGRSRRFKILCPEALLKGARAREAGVIEPESEGVTMPAVGPAAGPPYSGHGSPEQRASIPGTEGVDPSNGGHNYTLQTSEPIKPPEPGVSASVRPAIAAAVAPLWKGAPRGSMQRDRKAKNQDIAESQRILAQDLEEQARRRAARGGES